MNRQLKETIGGNMIRFLLVLSGILALAVSVTAQANDQLKYAGKGTIGNEVVIGSFTVAFYHRKEDRMATFEGGVREMEVGLSGLSRAQLAKVTDIAYEVFVLQLKEAGITVRDRAALAALLNGGGGLRPLDNGYNLKLDLGRNGGSGNAFLFSPSALGGPVFNREHPPLTAMFSGPLGGFKMASMMPAALHFEKITKEYAKDNAVAVINPILIVDFADFAKYDGSYRRSIKAEASLALAGIVNKVELTSVQFYGDNGKDGRIVLESPIAVAGGFGRVIKRRSDPIEDLESTYSASSHSFVVEPAQWAEGMAQLLLEGSNAFAGAIAAR
jgi:hypothetical protein